MQEKEGIACRHILAVRNILQDKSLDKMKVFERWKIHPFQVISAEPVLEIKNPNQVSTVGAPKKNQRIMPRIELALQGKGLNIKISSLNILEVKPSTERLTRSKVKRTDFNSNEESSYQIKKFKIND